MKRKSDFIKELTVIFTDSELVEAGIVDGAEYLGTFLTINELKDYRKWAQNTLQPAISYIKKIRKQLPDHVWKNYQAFNLKMPEQKLLLEAQKDLKKVWRSMPKIADRVLEKEITNSPTSEVEVKRG